MKPMATLLAGLLITGTVGAGDVYITKDAQGRTIYTDTPQSLPAEKINIHRAVTIPATAAQGNPSETKQVKQDDQAYAKSRGQKAAAQTTAEDRAQRCVDARKRYQTLMENWRLYEPGPNGERTYLTSEQIDQARANAKQVMDQFCTDE